MDRSIESIVDAVQPDRFFRKAFLKTGLIAATSKAAYTAIVSITFKD